MPQVTSLRPRPTLQYKAGLHPEPPGTGQGVMIALRLPADAAGQIAQPGGLPADQLHVTLVYLGHADEMNDLDQDTLVAAMRNVAGRWSPVEAQVSGIGRFHAPGSDDGDPVWAPFDAPELPELRAAVLSAVLEAGGDPPTDHGYIPHITVGYMDPGEDGIPVSVIGPVAMTVPALSVWWAGQVTDLPLVADHGPALL